MDWLCRDCLWMGTTPAGRCPVCGGARLRHHGELNRLLIAHLDCDAFYAAIEKRDNPALADRPVIIGGGKRGVVATCCYVARRFGIRSAMPMFQALKRCPEAVVIKPDMAKYAAIGAEIRVLMRTVSPRIEPLSIDEAFLDLSAAEDARAAPARAMAELARRIRHETGLTVSIGLSYNKFLAKIASDLDKPDGFSMIGRVEAPQFLANKPVRLLWGVGPAMAARLQRDGIARIGQLQQLSREALQAGYGALGERLYHFARGEDSRQIGGGAVRKSLSAETTFAADLNDPAALTRRLDRLCGRVARGLTGKGLAGRSVVLKLKTADFRLRTRQTRLPYPTQREAVIRTAARSLLVREATGEDFRLIGIGVAELTPPAAADPDDLFSWEERSEISADGR